MNLTERIYKLEQKVEDYISSNNNAINKLDVILERLEKIDELFKTIGGEIKSQEKILKSNFEVLSKRFEEYNVKNISYRTEEINKIKYLQNYMNEMYFARLLADSVGNSFWLKDKSISLYGWAANYSFIYILFRILDKVSLNNILEFGLGQTSKLTTQYAKFKNQQSKLFICEHNEEWIDTYKEELELSENISINLLWLEEFEYDGGINDKYSNLSPLISNIRFSLIIVDGPVGWGKNLPRTNILDIIENDNLDDDFIIIIDDSSRQGEKNTISKVENLLSNKDIKYTKFTRSGIKEQTIIVSKGYDFIQYL